MSIITKDQIKSGTLDGKTIAIIGYGSQGRAHALNLHDSGHTVVVGVREGGKGWKKAKEDGLTTAEPAEAARQGDIVAMLTPDMTHEALWRDTVAPNMKSGAAALFAHGFSVIYGLVKPAADIDVILAAPKGPGDLVRREFQRGRGVPSLIAVYQDATGNARDLALGYVSGIGGSNGGVIETTFKEETETDLFGEQAVLCGGASELVLAGFETLVKAGYKPEVAYFECLHELKLIVDLMYEGGLEKMLHFISETAKYGDFVSGPRVINDETKARMKEVLTDIQSGAFARNWISENQQGLPEYKKAWEADLTHPIEVVGKDLRSRMSWISAPADKA